MKEDMEKGKLYMQPHTVSPIHFYTLPLLSSDIHARVLYAAHIVDNKNDPLPLAKILFFLKSRHS